MGGISGPELRVGFLDACHRGSGAVTGCWRFPARDCEIGGWKWPRRRGRAELLVGSSVVGNNEEEERTGLGRGKEQEERKR